jgi:hypothetical protein
VRKVYVFRSQKRATEAFRAASARLVDSIEREDHTNLSIRTKDDEIRFLYCPINVSFERIEGMRDLDLVCMKDLSQAVRDIQNEILFRQKVMRKAD